MRLQAIILIFALCACAPPTEEQTYSVTVHTVRQVDLQEMVTPVDYMVYGSVGRSETSCDIYMISRGEAQEVVYNYVNPDGSFTEMTGDVFYEWLLGHEYRHCLEGKFH